MLIPESDVEIIPLFPSISMLVDTNPEFQEVRSGLIEYSYEERMRDEDGIYRSNVGGWHSNTQILKDPKFATYKQFLEKYVTKCFEKFAIDGSVIDISSCWVNINGYDSANSLHNHPGCDVSGCLWVKSDPTTGAFRMSNPHDFYQHGMLSMANDDIKNRYLIFSASKNIDKICPNMNNKNSFGVNTFRIIFNCLSDTGKYDLLEIKSFYASYGAKTGEINYGFNKIIQITMQINKILNVN